MWTLPRGTADIQATTFPSLQCRLFSGLTRQSLACRLIVSFMKNRFGNLLRKLRIESGRSIGEVARHLEVSTVYISDVERGVRAPLTAERILRAAQFLGVKP